MRERKQKRLEARGWRIGETAEFLNLTSGESAYIELKLQLARGLREERERLNLTQSQLAALVSSSQSRVAKMEAGDPSVSIDLLVRSLLALGAGKRDIAGIIGSRRP